MIDGQIWTGAHTQIVRDNFAETAPAKATAAGRFFASTGANGIAERIPSVASVVTAQSTASGSFTDLTTVGPQVTVTTGTQVFLAMHARASSDTINAISRFATAVSGATTNGADINLGFAYQSNPAGSLINGTVALLYSGLTAGSNVFTMQYRTDGTGTSTFSSRRFSVIPF